MFQIDRFGRQPIYEQIIEQTEELVASGALKPGDQLPSVRALSQALSTNPNTLQKAYAELERRGVTVSAPGNGRFIAVNAKQAVSQGLEALLEDVAGLAEKLRNANVPKQRVLDAVQAAYGFQSHTPPEAKPGCAQPDAEKGGQAAPSEGGTP